ncbi:MAG: hypothetical protein WBD16_06795 [Pyrinomonadaceae bacterium]
MKKRILISFAVAVFLLEVGFGVYVAFERKYEYALNRLSLPVDSVKPISSDTDRDLEIANLLPEDDFVADAHVVLAAKRPSTRPVITNSAGKKISATSLAPDRPVISVAKTEPNKQQPDKQTSSTKTSETREIPATDLNSQKESPRTDNKSFIAKTQTILKKPFGWIKAIGSKLR